MENNINNENMFVKRFESLKNPVLDCFLIEEDKLDNVEKLLEDFNNSENTFFKLNKFTKEIYNVSIIKESNESISNNFLKLISFLENNGFDNVALTEGKKNTVFSYLFENDLEKAEIILAIQMLNERIQKNLNDISSLYYNEFLHITDKIKTNFGSKLGSLWKEKIDNIFSNSLSNLIGLKEEITKFNNKFSEFLEKDIDGDEINDMMMHDKDYYSTPKENGEKNNNYDDNEEYREPKKLERSLKEESKENNFKIVKSNKKHLLKIYFNDKHYYIKKKNNKFLLKDGTIKQFNSLKEIIDYLENKTNNLTDVMEEEKSNLNIGNWGNVYDIDVNDSLEDLIIFDVKKNNKKVTIYYIKGKDFFYISGKDNKKFISFDDAMRYVENNNLLSENTTLNKALSMIEEDISNGVDFESTLKVTSFIVGLDEDTLKKEFYLKKKIN